MNEISNVRKNVFKKGSGFSKYDRNGNVIYSESIGRKGETVRHFYNYDDITSNLADNLANYIA